MDLNVTTLDGSSAGTVSLSDAVFGLEPRADLLQRVVRWQLAKKQAGTHKALGRSEVSRTGAKMYRQKGTGNARHGPRSVVQFRGGGAVHGPTVRDHGYSLPKKVRRLGLKSALSAKVAEGKVIVVDELKTSGKNAGKTASLKASLARLGAENALMIGGAELDSNLVRAASNLPFVDVLPQQGINVYDILRRDVLVLSKDAAAHIEERLK